MSDTDNLPRGLDAAAFPAYPEGLLFTIYLYRAAEPRPQSAFVPMDWEWDEELRQAMREIKGDPNSYPDQGYRFREVTRIAKEYADFRLFVDHSSLQRDEPLWFHTHVRPLGLKFCQMTLFTKSGGGGTPLQSRSENDSATLTDLFHSLRAFPEGWTQVHESEEEGSRI